MKIASLALSGLLALAAIPNAQAEDWKLPAQKTATVLGATAASVALAGPFGLIGGGLLAAWMHNTLDEAAAAETAREELSIAQAELAASEAALARTSTELEEAEAASAQYAQLVLDQLQLEMLFKTNAAELTNTGQLRLAALAEFLVANPQVAVRLDGYADPRGSDSHNQQLSLGRVNHVAHVLEQHGVDAERIERFSHGASRSVAAEGDYDAYALERSVKIELSQPTAKGIAAVD